MELYERLGRGDEDEEGLDWRAGARGAQRLRTPRGIDTVWLGSNLIRLGREDVASGALRITGVEMLEEAGPGKYGDADE